MSGRRANSQPAGASWPQTSDTGIKVGAGRELAMGQGTHLPAQPALPRPSRPMLLNNAY
jgi:hypothetical protein